MTSFSIGMPLLPSTPSTGHPMGSGSLWILLSRPSVSALTSDSRSTASLILCAALRLASYESCSERIRLNSLRQSCCLHMDLR